MAEGGAADTPGVGVQDTPMTDQGVTGSSTSSFFSPPENSLSNAPAPASTKGRSTGFSTSTVVSTPETSLANASTPMEVFSTESQSTGTDRTVDMVMSAAQAQRDADAFLDSISSFLSPRLHTDLVQGLGQASPDQEMQEAPENPTLPRPNSGPVQFRIPSHTQTPKTPTSQLPKHGQIPVRDTPMTDSSVSTLGQKAAQASTPRSMEPTSSLTRETPLETLREAALLTQTFQNRFVLRAPSTPDLPQQSSAMRPIAPASGAWKGFGSSSYGAASRQGPIGESLQPMKRAEARRAQPKLSSIPQAVPGLDGQADDDQTPIGSLVLENLSDQDVLFYFGTLCIIGRLSPEFLFKYGGRNGNQVGARLIMFGHTILIAPDLSSAYMARAVACRRALIEMQSYHPDWMVPPLPVNSAAQPQWNWLGMIDGFCKDFNWPPPIYNTHILGNQWHSEVIVNGIYFRSFQGCGNRMESENTVSHHALYQLLIMDDIDVTNILPVDSHELILPDARKPVTPPDENAIHNKTRLLKEAIESLRPYSAETSKSHSLQNTSDALDTRHQKKEIKPAGGVSGLSGGKIAKTPAKPAKPAKPAPKKGEKKSGNTPKKPKGVPPPPPPPPPRGGSGMSRRRARSFRRYRGRLSPLPQDEGKVKEEDVEDSRAKTPPRNANHEPVLNARLAPVEMEVEVAEDPLATLKGIQERLQGLSPHASYLRLMKTMCSVLNISEPDIRCEQAAGNTPNPMYALFNDPNPYLTRASPVFLANGGWVDEESAHSLGVKKVILFLLKMCKDEVDVDVLDASWKRELKFLSNLEREIKDRVDRLEN